MRAKTSGRVINALILREIGARFGNSRLGYLWAFITPLASIGVLYFVFRTIRGRETELPLGLFLITGWFTYGFYQSMVSRLGSAESANLSLLMQPTVTRLDGLVSRGMLEILTSLSFFVIGSFIAVVLEDSPLPNDLGLVFFSLFAAGGFGLGVGLVLAGLATYFPFAINFVQPINRIGFFISGVLFTVSLLPSWTYQYIKWNPLVHPIEGVRQGWFESYQSPVLDLNYTYICAVILVALGLHLERRTRRGIKLG